MDNIFNKDFWIKQWEDEKKSSTYNVHRGFTTPEYWDEAADTYNPKKKQIKNRRLERTISFFKTGGFLSEGMKVLDIGCGTGMLAMELAKNSAQVTALDFSRGMLDQFEKNITPDIKENITILHQDWHAVDIKAKKWEKKFDLVIAFMSPGVATPEAFFKMMNCSKKACAIRGWAGKRKHPVLSELWQKIMDTPLEDKPQSILYKINLLFSMGLFPEITFDTIEWDQKATVQDELKRQMAFFKKVSRKTDAELEEIILKYLNRIAKDNMIVRQHQGLTATAAWDMRSRSL